MEIQHPYLGTFIVVKQVGTGTFAAVYEARQVSLNYRVAIKIFNKSFPEDDVRKAFNIASSIKHPFICQEFDLFKSQDGRLCILMEYVEGMTLLEYANNCTQIKISELRLIIGQLIIALDYLHSKNVIHRDLKCENIIIDVNGNVRLIDFGFAGVGDLHSTTCGSTEYLAPEIIKEEVYGSPIDIWSLGVVIYAIAHGELPFQNPNLTKLFHMISKLHPTFSSDEEIHPQLVDLIKRMLIKDPKKRITLKEIQDHPFFTTDDLDNHYKFDVHKYDQFIDYNLSCNPSFDIIKQLQLSPQNEMKLINDLKFHKNTPHTMAYAIIHKNQISNIELREIGLGFLEPEDTFNPAPVIHAAKTYDGEFLLCSKLRCCQLLRKSNLALAYEKRAKPQQHSDDQCTTPHFAFSTPIVARKRTIKNLPILCPNLFPSTIAGTTRRRQSCGPCARAEFSCTFKE